MARARRQERQPALSPRSTPGKQRDHPLSRNADDQRRTGRRPAHDADHSCGRHRQREPHRAYERAVVFTRAANRGDEQAQRSVPGRDYVSIDEHSAAGAGSVTFPGAFRLRGRARPSRRPEAVQSRSRAAASAAGCTAAIVAGLIFSHDAQQSLRADSPTHAPPASAPLHLLLYIAPAIIRSANMVSLNESELTKQLGAEGFTHTYVWQDRPNAFYSDHTHAGLTAHIILDGEMTLTCGGKSETFRVGDRFASVIAAMFLQALFIRHGWVRAAVATWSARNSQF